MIRKSFKLQLNMFNENELANPLVESIKQCGSTSLTIPTQEGPDTLPRLEDQLTHFPYNR